MVEARCFLVWLSTRENCENVRADEKRGESSGSTERNSYLQQQAGPVSRGLSEQAPELDRFFGADHGADLRAGPETGSRAGWSAARGGNFRGQPSSSLYDRHLEQDPVVKA